MKKKQRVIIFFIILMIIMISIIVLIIPQKDEWNQVNITKGEIEQTKDYKLYEFAIKGNEICDSMDEIVEDVIYRYSNLLDYEYVDVTENMGLSNIYNIVSVPTFLLVDQEGKVIERRVGKMTREELIDMLSGIN